MLSSLGYTEGSLEDKERALSAAIISLQQETFYLNGKEVYDWIIRDISQALPYFEDYQSLYREYLKDLLGSSILEAANTTDLKQIGGQIIEDLYGSGWSISVSEDGSSFRGYNRQKGGSTAKFYFTDVFSQLGKKAGDRILSKAKSKGISATISTTEDQLKAMIELNPNMIYSFLKTSHTPDKITGVTIDKLIQTFPNLVNIVKDNLKTKIKNKYSGKNSKIFHEVVDEIISQAPITALFTGQNAANNITGLLGEIQGLFYIRVILNDKKSSAKASWTATQTFGGNTKQVHTDILLEDVLGSYGIQIKNTSLEQALAQEKAINFQSFESSKAKHFIDGNLSIINPTENIKQVLGENDLELYYAIDNILAMENFNIEYIWENKAPKIAPNKDFSPVRIDIERLAQLAKKAILVFSAASMFMQMSNEVNLKTGGGNSLYIIGGTLAITSATIISDIIKDLENNIQRFSVEYKTRAKTQGEKGKNFTIVDFFRATSHTGEVYTSLNTSYNF